LPAHPLYCAHDTGSAFRRSCERKQVAHSQHACRRCCTRGRVSRSAPHGQHVVHFAPASSGSAGSPASGGNCCRLNARIRNEGSVNVLPAIELDVFGAWPDHEYAAVYSANTAHIMSWAGVCAMFSGVGRRCAAPGCLPVGPFNLGWSLHVRQTSNRPWTTLRESDPDMGLA